MPSHLFLHFTLLPFALFKRSGTDEFSEVIPANTSFTSESLYQLIHEGHTELYFDKQHIRNFSKSLIEQLEGRITAPEKHSCHDQIKIEAEVFHSSRDIINSLSLKPKVVSICDKAISNLKTRLKIEKDLMTYLDKLNVKSTYHYHFSHVSISSFIAFQVINQKEIPSYKKDELALKLLFSAYFSDLAISEETVSHYPRITPDVLKIIHETNEAKNRLSKESQLHPLSSILIVAQNFADQILLNRAISNKEILDNLELRFKGTPCQSAYFDLLAIFS